MDNSEEDQSAAQRTAAFLEANARELNRSMDLQGLHLWARLWTVANTFIERRKWAGSGGLAWEIGWIIWASARVNLAAAIKGTHCSSEIADRIAGLRFL